MDTPTAITTLTSMLGTINSNITGLQAQAQAIQVALDQLNGVLNTPSADLKEADTQITDLEAEVQTLSDTQETPPISEPPTQDQVAS